MCRGIINSCRSAATSGIVKRLDTSFTPASASSFSKYRTFLLFYLSNLQKMAVERFRASVVIYYLGNSHTRPRALDVADSSST